MDKDRKLSRVAMAGILVAVATVIIVLMNKSLPSAQPATTERDPTSRADNKSAPPAVAPEFALKDLSGNLMKLSDYRGKVVIVNFWATWCLPCRMEIPTFIKLTQKYRARGLEIIGVSVDEDGADGVQSFAETSGINYPVAIANPDTIESYGPIDAIPTTFIIDREGRVYQAHRGMVTYEKIESAIKSIL
jgi:peroxiredoxin